MVKLLKISCITLLLLTGRPLFAWHIIGGEMIYTHLSGYDYELKLKIYRDCSAPDAADFDDPLLLYIYNASGILVQTISINFPGADYINPDLSNPCMTNLPDLCVQEGIYTTVVTLPPSVGGYDLVYQRCCRNSTIVNIYNPLQTGATYTEHIPDPGTIINSSPRFTNFPPIVICGNFPFVFDHSATDPDGDQLVYDFFTPYAGASFDFPLPAPAPGPPFDPVVFYPPFSESYPIESDPAFTIDPITGTLAGTPTAFGQYVVGIAVREYRDGVLIGTHYRDFQFNITDCEPALVAAMPNEINHCSDYTVHFQNWSYGTDAFYWDFGVPGITSDTSIEEDPSYTYPDTGTYQVMLIAFPGQICSDTAYATVLVYPELIADMDASTACAQNPMHFDDMSTSMYGTITDWQWNFGDGTESDTEDPDHVYVEPGTYNVTLQVKNSYGCTENYSQSVHVEHLPYPMFAYDHACPGQTGTVYSTSVIFPGNTITDYQWEFENGDTFTGDTFDYYFDSPGDYPITLTATSNLGCIDSISGFIHVPEPVSAIPPADVTICAGDSIQLIAEGGTAYVWSPAGSVSDPAVADPIVFPDVTTTYTITVADQCTEDIAQVTVGVLPAPEMEAGPDTIVYHNHPVQMWAFGADLYSWSPAEGLSDPFIADPIALPDATTQYIITGTGKNGCSTVDTALVYIIPDCFHFATVNAFSPNGDGVNDRFRFVTNGDDALVDMQIYNRWGQLIFSTDNLEEGWDGSDGNGVQQEVGTYLFIIHTQCDGILQSLSGSVTLLR
ncbi:MAG: PKD domain-containing protein [Chitinophagales bacterium]